MACLYSENLTRCTAHEPTVVAMCVDSGNKFLHTYIANISQHKVQITWDIEIVNGIVNWFVRSFPICQYMRHMYRNNAPCERDKVLGWVTDVATDEIEHFAMPLPIASFVSQYRGRQSPGPHTPVLFYTHGGSAIDQFWSFALVISHSAVGR